MLGIILHYRNYRDYRKLCCQKVTSSCFVLFRSNEFVLISLSVISIFMSKPCIKGELDRDDYKHIQDIS